MSARDGHAVVMARLTAGLSRRDLAAAIPWMTMARLERIETGREQLTPKDLGAIRRATRCS